MVIRYGTSKKGKGAKTVLGSDLPHDSGLRDLKPSTTYYVDIAAQSASGARSPFSKRVKMKTRAVSKPGKPRLVQAQPSSLTVSWDPPPISGGVGWYRVRYGTSKTGKNARTTYVGWHITSLTIPELKATRRTTSTSRPSTSARSITRKRPPV